MYMCLTMPGKWKLLISNSEGHLVYNEDRSLLTLASMKRGFSYIVSDFWDSKWEEKFHGSG
jgi:hypothetical protein